MKHSRVLGQVKLGVDNAVSVQPGFSPATQERAQDLGHGKVDPGKGDEDREDLPVLTTT